MKLLLVCTANICRSPMAHGALDRLVRERGLNASITIDSAATHDYFIGAPPETQACEEAAGRGFDISGLRARAVTRADFDAFDLVLAMDRQNLAHLQYLAPSSQRDKVRLFMSFAERRASDVPDPYGGGARKFKRTMDIIERGAGAVASYLAEDAIRDA